jgi:nitrogen fixation/metabolism regulation signal transduction histidine kinase
MEEHGGTLTLTDAPSGQGARVTLHFPRIDVLEHTPVEDALS